MKTDDYTFVPVNAYIAAVDPAPGQAVSCLTARVVLPTTISDIALPNPTTIHIDTVKWSASLSGDQRDVNPRPVLVQ